MTFSPSLACTVATNLPPYTGRVHLIVSFSFAIDVQSPRSAPPHFAATRGATSRPIWVAAINTVVAPDNSIALAMASVAASGVYLSMAT